MSFRYLLGTFLIIVSFGSCMGHFSKSSGSGVKPASLASSRSLDEIQADIEDLTSELTCASDDQCKIAQYGVQKCGGPTHFQVYSKNSANETKLFQLASEYNSVNQKINSQSPTVGTCQMLELPKVGCVNSGCAELP